MRHGPDTRLPPARRPEVQADQRAGSGVGCQCGRARNEASSDFAGLGGLIFRGSGLLGCNLGTVPVVATATSMSAVGATMPPHHWDLKQRPFLKSESRFKWPRLTWTLLRLEPLDSESAEARSDDFL